MQTGRWNCILFLLFSIHVSLHLSLKSLPLNTFILSFLQVFYLLPGLRFPGLCLALWPLFPLLKLHFPCLSFASQQHKQNNTGTGTGSLTKRRATGKKTLLIKKQTSIFKRFAGRCLLTHPLFQMWNFQQYGFPFSGGGEEVILGRMTEPMGGILDFSDFNSWIKFKISPLHLCSFFLSESLLLEFKGPSSALNCESWLPLKPGAHMYVFRGSSGPWGLRLNNNSPVVCLLICLNLYKRSTRPAVPECLFIIIFKIHSRLWIPTVDLLHYCTNNNSLSYPMPQVQESVIGKEAGMNF